MNEKLILFAKKAYKHTPLIVFCFMFVLFAYIAWCSPLVSDDLQFAGYGYTSIKEYIHFSLNYGNGRFLGNLFSGILSGNRILFSCFNGFSMALIAVMIPKVAESENNLSYLLSSLLLILCSSEMFSQVYAWTSGFSNYIPPIALALTIACIIINYNKLSTPPRKKSPIKKIIAVLYCAVIGYSMQLFTEHCTVLFLLLSVAFVIHSFTKKDGKRFLSVVLFLSTFAGAATMFLIPKFFGNESQTSEGYRRILLGNPYALIFNILDIGRTLISSWFAIICLTTVVLIVFHNNKDKISIKKYNILKSLFLLFALLSVFGQLLFKQQFYGIAVSLIWILFAGCMICYFALLFAILFSCGKKAVNTQIIVCFLSVIVVIGMLSCVKPFFERCLFLPYVLIAIAIICLLEKNVFSTDSNKIFAKAAFSCASISLAVLFGLFIIMFSEIKLLSAAQDKYIRTQMTSQTKEIEIFDIPYNYVKNYENGWAHERYYYNNEWGDVEFIFIDCDEWINAHREYFSLSDIFYTYTPVEHK